MTNSRAASAVFGAALMVVMAAGCAGCDSSTAPAGGGRKPADARGEAERILREDGPRAMNISFRRERAKALTALGDAAVEPAAKAIESEDYGTRLLAANALSLLGEKGRVALIAALSSSNSRTRFSAAGYLKDTGDVRALPGLLKMVDSWAMTHKNVGKALIKIGPPAVDGLIELLDAPQRDVRRGAMGLLGEIGDARAIDPLAALLTHRDFFVRVTAANALAKYGPRAIPALAKILNGSNQYAIQLAARVLGGMDDTRAAAALAAALAPDRSNHDVISGLVQLGAKSIDALLPILKADDRKLVRAASNALSRIPDPRVVAPLLYAHTRGVLDRLAAKPAIVEGPALKVLERADASPDARAAAARLLGLIKAKSAVQPLIELAQISSKRGGVIVLQRATIRALGAIGDSSAIAALKKMMDETPSRYCRERAIESLGALGAKDMVDRFIRELDSTPSWTTEQALLHAFGSLRAGKAIPAIGRYIKRRQSNFQLVALAIEVLEKIGDPAAVGVIEGMAIHKTEYVRSAVAKALGTFGRPASVKILKAMAREKAYVQVSIVVACGRIGTPEAMGVVRQLACDGIPDARKRAISELMKHDPTTVAFLIERYPDETNWSVRSAILDVFRKQKTVAAMPLFLAAAKDTAIEASGARTRAFWGLASMGNAATVTVLDKYMAETKAEMNRNRNSHTIHMYASARDALDSLKNRLRPKNKPRTRRNKKDK